MVLYENSIYLFILQVITREKMNGPNQEVKEDSKNAISNNLETQNC